METLLLTLSPFVVAILTNLVKPIKSSPLAGYRKTVVRFLAAFFSFGSVLLASYMSGEPMDLTAIDTFAQALMVFLGATGTYFLTKKSV